MMALPAHPEARFQVLGMEESLKANPGCRENIIRKPECCAAPET